VTVTAAAAAATAAADSPRHAQSESCAGRRRYPSSAYSAGPATVWKPLSTVPSLSGSPRPCRRRAAQAAAIEVTAGRRLLDAQQALACRGVAVEAAAVAVIAAVGPGDEGRVVKEEVDKEERGVERHHDAGAEDETLEELL
jgi:hypothetical protein